MKWRIKIQFEPRDLWVGLYWTKKPKNVHPKLHWWDIYICIVPMFPIRIFQYIPFEGTGGQE